MVTLDGLIPKHCGNEDKEAAMVEGEEATLLVGKEPSQPTLVGDSITTAQESHKEDGQ